MLAVGTPHSHQKRSTQKMKDVTDMVPALHSAHHSLQCPISPLPSMRRGKQVGHDQRSNHFAKLQFGVVDLEVQKGTFLTGCRNDCVFHFFHTPVPFQQSPPSPEP